MSTIIIYIFRYRVTFERRSKHKADNTSVHPKRSKNHHIVQGLELQDAENGVDNPALQLDSEDEEYAKTTETSLSFQKHRSSIKSSSSESGFEIPKPKHYTKPGKDESNNITSIDKADDVEGIYNQVDDDDILLRENDVHVKLQETEQKTIAKTTKAIAPSPPSERVSNQATAKRDGAFDTVELQEPENKETVKQNGYIEPEENKEDFYEPVEKVDTTDRYTKLKTPEKSPVENKKGIVSVNDDSIHERSKTRENESKSTSKYTFKTKNMLAEPSAERARARIASSSSDNSERENKDSSGVQLPVIRSKPREPIPSLLSMDEESHIYGNVSSPQIKKEQKASAPKAPRPQPRKVSKQQAPSRPLSTASTKEDKGDNSRKSSYDGPIYDTLRASIDAGKISKRKSSETSSLDSNQRTRDVAESRLEVVSEKPPQLVPRQPKQEKDYKRRSKAEYSLTLAKTEEELQRPKSGLNVDFPTHESLPSKQDITGREDIVGGGKHRGTVYENYKQTDSSESEISSGGSEDLDHEDIESLPLPKRMSTMSDLSQQVQENGKRGTVYENYQSSTSDDSSLRDLTPPPSLPKRENRGTIYENYQSSSTLESSDEELQPTPIKMKEQEDLKANYANYTIPQRKTRSETSDSDLSTDEEPDYVNCNQRDEEDEVNDKIDDSDEDKMETTDTIKHSDQEDDQEDENENYKKRLSAHQSPYSTFTIPGVDFSDEIEKFNKGVTHDTSSFSDTSQDDSMSDHELYDTIKFEWTEKSGKKWPAKKTTV